MLGALGVSNAARRMSAMRAIACEKSAQSRRHVDSDAYRKMFQCRCV